MTPRALAFLERLDKEKLPVELQTATAYQPTFAEAGSSLKLDNGG